MTPAEPRNPLYLLLLVAGAIFCVTALACALLPVIEQKALEAGAPLPPSDFRDALRTDGWRWLLWQLGVLFVLAIASMVFDRLRSLRQEASSAQNDATPPTRPSP